MRYDEDKKKYHWTTNRFFNYGFSVAWHTEDNEEYDNEFEGRLP